MRRGEIWTVLADGYARKPRPVVVVQNDEIEGFDSTVVCLMTSFTSDDMTTRVKVPPTTQNGLIKISWVMTEKILAVHTSALGQRIGTEVCNQDVGARECERVRESARTRFDGLLTWMQILSGGNPSRSRRKHGPW